MTCTSRIIASALALLSIATGGIATAQTVANGPYYATPSWDQTLPAASRFLVLANMRSEAVLDRETGLVWWRSPNLSPTILGFAQNICANSRVGGRLGWRLPTLGEVLSLFDPAASAAPFLPAGHPFTGFASSATFFWTSTPYLGGGTFTYRVGYSSSSSPVSASAAVPSDANSTLCVRGAG